MSGTSLFIIVIFFFFMHCVKKFLKCVFIKKVTEDVCFLTVIKVYDVISLFLFISLVYAVELVNTVFN